MPPIKNPVFLVKDRIPSKGGSISIFLKSFYLQFNQMLEDLSMFVCGEFSYQF